MKISVRVAGSALDRLARIANGLEAGVARVARSTLTREIATDRNEFGLAAVLPATWARLRAAARALFRIRKR